MLKGLPVSPGIAIGPAYILSGEELAIDKSRVELPSLEAETDRLKAAVCATLEQLQKIQSESAAQGNEKAAEIVDAQSAILMDEEFLQEICNEILQKAVKAENALHQIIGGYVKKFEKMKDPYLQERVADIRDAGHRILSNLLDVEPPDLRTLPIGCIIVAKELMPSQTAQLPTDKIAGLCVETGGKTSHVAIMAKSLGIPAIVGVEGAAFRIGNGERIILDAQRGEIVTNPTEKQLNEYSTKQGSYQEYVRKLQELLPLPAVTRDEKCTVKLYANIAAPEETETALAHGAEGVGLYRSEFLYMNCSNFPSEETQFEAYRQAAAAMAPRPVTIRTLDIGGDKELPYFQFPKETNPFLGWRAIRLCLDRPEIFLTQLRAILRASRYGKVRLMYPMISSCGEVFAANAVLEQAKQQLREENILFDEKIEVGVMVEIPSAAVCVDLLTNEVDFFCIGTNDLIQYTLAADRMNEKLSAIYQPFNPGVLRLIQHVIKTAHAAGKPVGVCGEMAGSVSAVPLLLGFGLDEFSMSPGALLHVKRIIRNSGMDTVTELAGWALRQADANVIQDRIQEYLNAID